MLLRFSLALHCLNYSFAVRPSALAQRLDEADGRSCCENVIDSMGWAVQGVRQFGAQLLRPGTDVAEATNILLHLVVGRRISVSTAFSGVGTPELSIRLLASALNSHTGATVPLLIEYLFGIEKRESCQEELLHLYDGPQCLFADQIGFICDGSRVKDDSPPAFVRKVVFESRVFDSLWCIRHGDTCVCRRADLHIAGTPCTDFSSMNSKRKLLSGNKNRYYFAWVRHRRHLREPTWVHENVVSFGGSHLEDDLGELYFIFRVVVCSTALGWASRRKRQFCIGVLKPLFTTLSRSPSTLPYTLADLEEFIRDTFGRSFRYGLLDYCDAPSDEFADELVWARSRPQSLAHPSNITPGTQPPPTGSPEEALIVEEHKRLLHNLGLGMKLFDLGQTPYDVYVAPVAAVLVMPTICHHSGLLWICSLRRWMTANEMLAGMGFPISPSLGR